MGMAAQGRKNKKLGIRTKAAFLAYLAETSNVTKAAAKAGVTKSQVYKLRRIDPEFAGQWRAALLEGYEHLELETLQHLREGAITGEPKFDIANALRLLVLHREYVASAQAEQRNVSAAEIRASIDRKVEHIRAQVKADKLRKGALK